MSTTSNQNVSKGTRWAVWILTLLILLAFVPSAVMKLMQTSTVLQGFAQMNVPRGAIVPIGIVELSCLILFLIPRTVVLGAFLLTGYLGGATLANIVNRSDFIHALVIGLMVWAVALLRVPELRTLLPIRKTDVLAPGRGAPAERPATPSERVDSGPHAFRK